MWGRYEDPFLVRPDPIKKSEGGYGPGFIWGLSGMQGWRKTMEDDHINLVR